MYNIILITICIISFYNSVLICVIREILGDTHNINMDMATVVRIEQEHLSNLSQNCGQNKATIYCHIFEFKVDFAKLLNVVGGWTFEPIQGN